MIDYRYKKGVNKFIKNKSEKKIIVLNTISIENSRTLKYHTYIFSETMALSIIYEKCGTN